MSVYPLWRRILGLPATKLGWWSVGLELGFIALFALAELGVEGHQ